MRLLFDLRSYPARLVLGVFTLILLTTLSAGVPAYWLTRAESERQAWSHVTGAEQATYSLLLAEQARLDDLLTLLAERPTLRRFLREENRADLAPYLRAFQEQSDLSILFLCQVRASPHSAAGTAALADQCPERAFNGFGFYESRPAMLSSRPIVTSTTDSPPVTAVAGKWLDQAFLRRLAADTGVAQSILLPDGTRIASSKGDNFLSPAKSEVTFVSGGRRLLDIDGKRFYTLLIPPRNQDDSAALLVEVALPVDELFAVRNRGLAVLSLSTGVVALLGTFLGVWAVRRMIDPLEQLTRTAQAISGGDLATPIPMPHGPREVRTLAKALQRSQASMLTALDDLAQAHAWLNSLVQSIVEGVITLDDAGQVAFINERAAALAATTVAAASGRHIDDLFAVTDEAGNHISLHRLPLGSKQRVTVTTLRLPETNGERTQGVPASGRESAATVHQPGQRTARRISRSPAPPTDLPVVLEVAATRLKASGGDEMQTALIVRDISQEESLRRLRSYFLANITHEFRTPLSAANASMELLMNEADLSTAEMRELLKPILLSLLSLQTLIDNLLESSRIEAGRFVLRRRPVDFNQVIATAVQVVQPLLERRRQTLSLTEPAYLPPLTGDAARLTQVMVNLLGNASKYSPTDTTIELDVAPRGGMLRVSVADHGPGVPRAESEHLFHRFVRLHAEQGEQYGIGLGLYVVKTTVEAHQGQVGVDEHPDGGSLFWFELPVEASDAQGEHTK